MTKCTIAVGYLKVFWAQTILINLELGCHIQVLYLSLLPQYQYIAICLFFSVSPSLNMAYCVFL